MAQTDSACTFHPTVQLFLTLTDVAPVSGGTVALAGHPSKPHLFVSVLELGKVLVVSTETSEIVSDLEVPEPFDEGPKGVAFDEAGDCLVLLVDDRITRWREQPLWTELGSGQELSADCECVSVDGRGRILLDLSPPGWLLPGGTIEPVPFEALPEEPPKDVDGDLDAVYKRQTWEATTTDLSNALMVACKDGAIFVYARDTKSTHYLVPGEAHARELSVRRPRLSRGIVVHMESHLPEEGCCCTSPHGGMFVVGALGDEDTDDDGALAVWSFSPDKAPSITRLTGFRSRPAQLDAVATDAAGMLYLCVVKQWPDRRAIYRVAPVEA